MPTHYARQLASAQAKIKAKGQLVNYYPVVGAFTPNDPTRPFEIGTPSGVDPNAPPAPIQTYMVFLDAKARGSSTQGMASEFEGRTDVPVGNKAGLLAGGTIIASVGDKIDRNTEGRSGYAINSVAKIKVIDVDGQPLLYTLELELGR